MGPIVLGILFLGVIVIALVTARRWRRERFVALMVVELGVAVGVLSSAIFAVRPYLALTFEHHDVVSRVAWVLLVAGALAALVGFIAILAGLPRAGNDTPSTPHGVEDHEDITGAVHERV